jgi:phage terminase small subunit
MSEKLTPKQEVFVAEVLAGASATEAARRAGYSPHTAYAIGAENLRKPQIRAVLEERRTLDAVRLKIQREDVIAGILSGIACAKAQGNAGGVISGWVAIAKIMGFYAPKVVNVDVEVKPQDDVRRVQYKLQGMTDEELVALSQGRRKLDS